MTILKFKKAIAGLSAVALVVGTSIAWAHGGATGIVKERMESMKVMGDSMKSVAAMVKGEKSFDAKAIAKAADQVSIHADKIPMMFPKGTNEKPSEALPKIWEDWDQFVEMGKNLKAEAENLKVAAEGGDKRAIMVGFAKTGKICSACHTDYRVKKN